ncbi:unnamed protein product [Vitrella brassicaformis CCMP3155]|uniref:SSD domain-containing protein n=1 Tax=Vitrella brassicaformis (strain CCMP3155) TaxID=1169540 RepID=A0A0G4FBE4_VITBC|nr:unnamed protein product [Vitrella brassicaformis CCMP3155]|eukprot:CEM10226.1 unnamed protein product [Vitrella brassicaformis CCMP3155]
MAGDAKKGVWCRLGEVRGLFQRVKERLVDGINEGFYRYTLFVYDFPCWFIWVPVLMALLMGVGILNRTEEYAPMKLYAIPDSQAMQDQARLTELFGTMPRVTYLLVEGIDGQNLLQAHILRALDRLDRQVANLTVTVDGKTYGYEDPRYESVCVKDGTGRCEHESVVQLYPPKEWKTDYGDDRNYEVDFTKSLNYPYHLQFRLDSSWSRNDSSLIRWPVPLLAANVTLEPEGCIEGCKVKAAEALLFRWLLRRNGSDDFWDPVLLAWEQAWLDLVWEQIPVFEEIGVRLVRNARRSVDDELEESTRLGLLDYARYVIGGIIIFSYCAIVNFSTIPHRSKSLPAFFGCFAVLWAVMFSAGLYYSLGFVHVPPIEATPFLCMGIGVDDMFVIFNSYALAVKVTDPRERVAVAIKDCGISITITTLTNLIAFGVGASSDYLSIRNFCIITFLALLMGYFYALTFFLASVCLDAKREAAGKGPYLETWCNTCRKRRRSSTPTPALKSAQPPPPPAAEEHHDPEQPQPDSTTEPEHEQEHHSVSISASHPSTPSRTSSPPPAALDTFELAALQLKAQELTIRQRRASTTSTTSTTSSSRQHGCSSGGFFGVHLGYEDGWDEARDGPMADVEEPVGTVGRKVRWAFRRFWGRWVTIPAVKVVTLLLFAGYLAVSVWGVTRMTTGLDLLWLTPEDSYYRVFWSRYFTSFTSYGEDVFVVFPNRQEWWKKEVREEYMAYEDRLRSGGYASDQVFSGMYEFYTRTDQATLEEEEDDPQGFTAELRKFLSKKEIKILASDFKFDEERENLLAYKLRFFASPDVSGAKLMTRSREDCHIAAEGPGGLECFPYGEYFPYYEQDVSIVQSTLLNMGYALIAVLLVSMFLMRDWQCWVLVMVMLVTIDVGLFGFLDFWDLKLNMMSMVCLILSVGFSVDYTTHMCHTFSHCVGPTRNHRVAETLILMGNPLLQGVVSTFLSMLVILTMRSFIFVIFFRMMTLVLWIGFGHGIILLPVILSLIGPKNDSHSHTHTHTAPEPTKTISMCASDNNNREGDSGTKAGQLISGQQIVGQQPAPSLWDTSEGDGVTTETDGREGEGEGDASCGHGEGEGVGAFSPPFISHLPSLASSSPSGSETSATRRQGDVPSP